VLDTAWLHLFWVSVIVILITSCYGLTDRYRCYCCSAAAAASDAAVITYADGSQCVGMVTSLTLCLFVLALKANWFEL